MAGASSEHGTSGNKLDTELNLVPFIDLLSTLVLFLLLTVVWVQIAALPASVDSKGKSAVAMVEHSKLLVHVVSQGYQLTWPSTLSQAGLPRSLRSLDQLTQLLAPLVKAGKAPPAAVSGDDEVDYGSVIRALDALKEAGLTLVALSTD